MYVCLCTYAHLDVGDLACECMCPKGPEKGTGSLELLNLGSLEKQQTFLTIETSL